MRSQRKKRVIITLKKNQKLLTIFRGINLEYFDSTKIKNDAELKLMNEWKIDKTLSFYEKKIILFPGRLTSWKGHEMFIESLNIFKQKNPDKLFYAIILGSDQGRKIYKKIYFKSLLDAEWYVFKKRWKKHSGKELRI